MNSFNQPQTKTETFNKQQASAQAFTENKGIPHDDLSYYSTISNGHIIKITSKIDDTFFYGVLITNNFYEINCNPEVQPEITIEIRTKYQRYVQEIGRYNRHWPEIYPEIIETLNEEDHREIIKLKNLSSMSDFMYELYGVYSQKGLIKEPLEEVIKHFKKIKEQQSQWEYDFLFHFLREEKKEKKNMLSKALDKIRNNKSDIALSLFLGSISCFLFHILCLSVINNHKYDLLTVDAIFDYFNYIKEQELFSWALFYLLGKLSILYLNRNKESMRRRADPFYKFNRGYPK
ncbi:TPA: hypothetical protein MYP09_001428 [Citrobacter farmeri]|nr:hypothetical protein [Citrobacter farmeri]